MSKEYGINNKKILYICYHNPFGTKGGGAMASHAYLRAFSELMDGALDLICSSTLQIEDHSDIKCSDIIYVRERNWIRKFSSIFTGYMNRYVPFTKKWISKNHDKYQLVVFDHSNVSGPLVEYVNTYGLKSITIHHNFERDFFKDNNKAIYKFLFLHHVIKWERTAYLKSTLNLFLTMHDMNKFHDIYGIGKGKNDLIGVFEFEDYSTPKEYPRCEKKTFVITGSLGVPQTIDAITYFFSDLYEYLPLESKVIVAGRKPSQQIVKLCSKHQNVELISDPADMNEIVSQADIYLCATRTGGGLKLRIMDGLKNGLPVITHFCSARGFEIFENEVFFKIYGTPLEFKKSVLELMRLNNNKKEIQNIYKKHFSYEAGVNRLKKILIAVH